VVPTGTGAARVRLRPSRHWRRRHAHRPGQHVVLGVDVKGVRHRRCFSITSAPDDDLLEVTVQAHPDGTVSPHLVHSPAPGDTVELGDVGGDFVLPDEPAAPLLMVTGGSGLTPVMAMIRHLARRQLGASRPDTSGVAPEHLDVVVLHHVTRPSALLFDAELPALAAAMPWLEVRIVTTRDEAGVRMPGVHLGADRLDELCADWRTRETWVCGPSGMVESMAALHETGALEAQLHVESFGVNAVRRLDLRDADAAERTSTVAFCTTGTDTTAGHDESLLVAAEAAGLQPAFGCRSGVCHTCTTRLESGVVRDLRDGRRHSAGAHVQLCVSAAVSDVTLDL